MNRISLEKVLIVFVAIFLMSRSRRIVEFFSDLDTDGILTLEPLRDSPPQARFFVTVMALALAYVTVYFYLQRRK
jgi:hypothetical protein